MLTNQNENKPSVVTADPGLDPDRFQQQVCELLEVPGTVPAAKVVEQLVGHLIPITPENQESINWLLAFVVSQNPKSLLEAQLIVEILQCHRLCTKMLNKAGKESWPEGAEKYVNTSAKLARSFRAGLETLGKLRRNGSQKILIERINIERDANAIIGEVNGRGCGENVG